MTKSLKQILRFVFILASIGSLYFVPWVLVKAWIMPLPTTIDTELQAGIDAGFDGMIVYVDKAGSPPQLFAAGWHNREQKIKAYPEAIFKIASITKLYLAVATIKLVHAQKLSLTKTVADYFPELSNKIHFADKITLAMLLQHRSGIPNLVDHPKFWTHPPKSRAATLNYALELPADFEPGTDYHYSNTNYLLIEDLIDKTLGYSRHEFIKAEILQPLGLKNTYGSLAEVNIDSVMSGYYVGFEKDLKDDTTGLMLATAEDVGIFLRALNEGTVFTKGEQELYAANYVFEHTGLLPGYQSIARYHPENDMVVIQFNNTTNFDGYEWSLAEIRYNRIVEIASRQHK